MTLAQKETVLSYGEKNLYSFPKQAYYPTYLFMRAAMDHTDLYSYAHCGFAQLRMMATGDLQKEGAVLSEILRGIASAQEVSRTVPNIEKTGEFVISVLKLGSKSLSASNRLRTAKIVNTLSGEWLSELQETREKLASDKRKSVRNATLGWKP